LNVLRANKLEELIQSNEKWLKKFGGRKILIVQVTMLDGSKRFILEESVRFPHRKGKNEEWHQKMNRLLARLPDSSGKISKD